MAKEKKLLEALFDCFNNFTSGIVYFKKETGNYVERLWSNREKNWYILYCEDICELCLSNDNRTNEVTGNFIGDTVSEKISTKNGAILRKIWLNLSGVNFEKFSKRQELHLKELIEKGVQLKNSKDNESKKKLGKRVWDMGALIPLDDLKIALNMQYNFVLELFLRDPYKILCERKDVDFFVSMIKEKEIKYTHDQIIALYTGGLLLGLNIPNEKEKETTRLINENIKEYLNSYFLETGEEINEGQTGEIYESRFGTVEISSEGKKFCKPTNFSLQRSFSGNKKKRSISIISIEEGINELIESNEKDYIERVILSQIKTKIDIAVKAIENSAHNMNMSFDRVDKKIAEMMEEIEISLETADIQIEESLDDTLYEVKRNVIAILRIYMISCTLQLLISYGQELLNRIPIKKEYSNIKENIKRYEKQNQRKMEELYSEEQELKNTLSKYSRR